MTDNNDQCQYNSCHHPLGPWVPSGLKVEGTSDIMERTCEKCGGMQTQFSSTDPKTNEAIDGLFAALSATEETE